MINADDFYGREAYSTSFQYLLKKTSSHALIAYPITKTLSNYGEVSRGICQINDSQELTHIDEIKKISQTDGKITYSKNNQSYNIHKDSLVSMNMFAFRSNILNHIESYMIKFFNHTEGIETKESYIPFLFLFAEKVEFDFVY